jgi:hypothetical protein
MMALTGCATRLLLRLLMSVVAIFSAMLFATAVKRVGG